jgi:hypothetical protein
MPTPTTLIQMESNGENPFTETQMVQVKNWAIDWCITHKVNDA